MCLFLSYSCYRLVYDPEEHSQRLVRQFSVDFRTCVQRERREVYYNSILSNIVIYCYFVSKNIQPLMTSSGRMVKQKVCTQEIEDLYIVSDWNDLNSFKLPVRGVSTMHIAS